MDWKDRMEPFIHLSKYPFIICKSCQFACVANEVYAHIKNHHPAIQINRRREIVRAVAAIPGIICNQEELQNFPLPKPAAEPVPFIQPLREDGMSCKKCGKVYRQPWQMREHCEKVHGWKNDWERGGDVVRKSKEPREVPWTMGVRCQRFFPSRAASGWFEIRCTSESPASSMGRAGAGKDVTKRIQQIHQAQEEKFRKKSRAKIWVANEKTEPNPWVERAGWARHLEGLSPERLRGATGPITGEEVVLQMMWDSLDRVMDAAQATAAARRAGLAALFEIQRKEMQVKPNRPFDNRLEDDTWARYKEVWRKLLCVLQRTQTWDEEERPPYRLTLKQRELYGAFRDAAARQGGVVARESELRGSESLGDIENSDGSEESGDAERSVISGEPVHGLKRPAEQTDEACLGMVIGLLDHQYKQSHYDSAIISGLAVLGIRDDGGWVEAMNYTPVYSAVIKVARMLVLYQSCLEREEDIARAMRDGMEEQEARDAARGVFGIVRGKVRRFMTRTGDDKGSEPTPMDWIFDTRTYGMYIRFNTPAEGKIDWRGERISYGQTQFTMGRLSDMLHELVEETRGLLAELAMVERKGTAWLPAIAWSRMEDDHSEDRVGYSFLQDDRNDGWVGKGEGWVLGRILGSSERMKAWLREEDDSDGGSDNPYRAGAIRKYGHAVEQFRERLWMVMHMVAGQPARSTEILGIRMVNTVDGGVRNILAHNGMMCFVTAYHKNFRSTGQAKVIHWYLPREVGELLVWYMWLVLPFWQQVQGLVKQAGERSAFLWADEIVKQEEEEEEKEEEEGKTKKVKGDKRAKVKGAKVMKGAKEDTEREEDAEFGAEGFADWMKERKWTSDRVRRIMQRHSERLLESRLGLSAWRHIAIGIANRYLRQAFGQGDEGRGEGVDDEEDEDGIEDNILDLQAGHGTHVAGMVYARELQQGAFGTALRREQFRTVSRQWHRFLGFGAEDWGWGSGAGVARAGTKRGKPDVFDNMREEARYRRFDRLQRVDIRAQLRMMIGEGATFRGQQEKVIRAIVRGESPVVQITGTGGGKSMSFMLPAFCSPDGTTIVVVPLVALREDLHGRCAESSIESHVWRSGGSNRAATMVFVTPESAVTKGFRDFVNRLQARQALDRVVVDECHVLLDSSREYRPKLQELGPALREWGVQTVFLTATLAPQDEGEFYRAAGLSAQRVRMFRSTTTRKNIEYGVKIVKGAAGKQEEEEDALVCRTVREWMSRHEGGEGRVIVYAQTIERVERLSKALGCERYHSKVEASIEGKIARLRRWIKSGRLIVATNALGLGVDVGEVRLGVNEVGSVRLVVHAGMPRKLREFVQESGRGGRDGARSRSVVICGEARKMKKGEEEGGGRANHGLKRQGPGAAQDAAEGKGWEPAAVEFVEGSRCRREVLDRVMDGRFRGSGCEADEEACDICASGQWEAEVEEMIEAAAAEEESEEATTVRESARIGQENFERQRRQARFTAWEASSGRMKAASEAEEFRQQLERWVGQCVVCSLGGEREVEHSMETCPGRSGDPWQRAQGFRGLVEREIFEKKRLAKYSGCFHCGLPQSVCSGWREEDTDGGRFTRVRGAGCQYKGVLGRVYGGVYGCYGEEANEGFREMMEADGFVRGGSDKWYRWLGSRIEWGGMETNRLCRGFYELCKFIESKPGGLGLKVDGWGNWD